MICFFLKRKNFFCFRPRKTKKIFSKCKIMMDVEFWADDLSELFASPMHFFPTSDMTRNEKLNAASRFWIYLAAILSVVHKSIYYILVAICALAVLSVLTKRYDVMEMRQRHNKPCRKPTADNPYMNNLVADNLVPCDHEQEAADRVYQQEFVYEDLDNMNTKLARRTFYTLPNGGIPDFEDFGKGLVIQS